MIVSDSLENICLLMQIFGGMNLFITTVLY